MRAGELRTIAAVCRAVPANPPRSFREAIQFVWFTQLGGILSENPLALNPGRFDQYMDPYYEADLAAGSITADEPRSLSTPSGSSTPNGSGPFPPTPPTISRATTSSRT